MITIIYTVKVLVSSFVLFVDSIDKDSMYSLPKMFDIKYLYYLLIETMNNLRDYAPLLKTELIKSIQIHYSTGK